MASTQATPSPTLPHLKNTNGGGSGNQRIFTLPPQMTGEDGIWGGAGVGLGGRGGYGVASKRINGK